MISVFATPAELEKLAKEKYCIPPFLMMENAARGMAEFIENLLAHSAPGQTPEQKSVLIICGKGNNGGDGYAVARLLQGKCNINVVSLEPPATEEAKAQHEMCKRLGITCSTPGTQQTDISRLTPAPDIILDCIYGTGFHGELPSDVKNLIDKMNALSGTKIACDIPSGLYFHADYTITMGSQKLALYSDKAKAVCGKIIVQNLGIAQEKFEAAGTTAAEITEISASGTSPAAASLIEQSDIRLPLRKNRSSHKGTFGHTAVFCGDKAGAAILAATAAMNFGSGLTSLVQTAESNLSQFKISPSLMISDSIPKKTTAILAGSGFTDFPAATAQQIKEWFAAYKTTQRSPAQGPAAVFDAGIITSAEFPEFLGELNRVEGARIILTPHLAEFITLIKNVFGEEYTVSQLAENPQLKIQLGARLNEMYPATAIIIKSANTFIAENHNCYIVADGSQSLSKGGSGDILAGLSVSLLAQGYTSKDAAITAAQYHAILSKKIGEEAFNLTPEKLLSEI